MTEFLHHLATFGADHVCSSVFPFLDRILQVARLSILLAEQEKTSPILLKSSAQLLPGKDQPTRLTGLTAAEHGC